MFTNFFEKKNPIFFLGGEKYVRGTQTKFEPKKIQK